MGYRNQESVSFQPQNKILSRRVLDDYSVD